MFLWKTTYNRPSWNRIKVGVPPCCNNKNTNLMISFSPISWSSTPGGMIMWMSLNICVYLLDGGRHCDRNHGGNCIAYLPTPYGSLPGYLATRRSSSRKGSSPFYRTHSQSCEDDAGPSWCVRHELRLGQLSLSLTFLPTCTMYSYVAGTNREICLKTQCLRQHEHIICPQSVVYQNKPCHQQPKIVGGRPNRLTDIRASLVATINRKP
jgi:hypothetical protein